MIPGLRPMLMRIRPGRMESLRLFSAGTAWAEEDFVSRAFFGVGFLDGDVESGLCLRFILVVL